MKTLIVFGSIPEVIKRLEDFLLQHKFRNIRLNTVNNELVAERKLFFLWRDYIHLRLRSFKDNITNIELSVNPLHEQPTTGDENKELSLQSRIYFYF